MKLVHYDTARRLADRALQKGADRVSLTTVEWDIAGSCDDPRLVSVCGRPEPKQKSRYQWKFDPLYAAKRLKLHIEQSKDARIMTSETLPIFVDLHTKCRKCETCMKEKRGKWVARMRREILASERTWMATMTIKPEKHYEYRLQCIERLRKLGTNFDSLSDAEQHKELVRTIGADITKYFKLLRTCTKATIRYVLVAERHKSGLPHFHALIHDCDPNRLIKKAELERYWRHGFTKFKLVENADKASFYVTKYIAKDLATRIRSSIKYGQITAFAIGAHGGVIGGVSPPYPNQHREAPDLPTPHLLFGSTGDCSNAMAEYISVLEKQAGKQASFQSALVNIWNDPAEYSALFPGTLAEREDTPAHQSRPPDISEEAPPYPS